MSLFACSNNVASMLGAPVGVENSDYKVIGAGGIVASIKPKSPEQSTYRYGFSIDLKKAEKLSAVKIERLNNDGSKTLIIDDSVNKTTAGSWQKQTPADAQSYLSGKGIGNVSWVGQSQSYNMTPNQAVWLYQRGNSRETYLITITDEQGNQQTLTQHTIIPSNVKATYLRFFQ